MTPNKHDDPLDRYMDAFGARLEAAAAPAAQRSRTRLRRLTLLAATATATALAITALLLVLPGGTAPHRLDVVAEARAALAPQLDELTHLVVRQRLAGDGRRDANPIPPVTIEQWSATRPVRWRVVYGMPHDDADGPGELIEIAYADGVQQEYNAKSNHLRRARGVRKLAAPAASPLGTDPIATMRGLLARGALRDAGATKVGDREVRRLVGTRSRTFHTPKGQRTYRSSVEYDVDPTSFAPVRARIGIPFPSATDAAPLFVVLDFETFERLPLTTDSAKLLRIQPKPGATTSELGRGR